MRIYLNLVFSFNCSVKNDYTPPGYSGNPVIRHIFTAHPCAMVYDDTLYLFTGHDEQNTTSEWFYMRDWHVFSTTDMVNYTDHGAKLSYTNFSWASGNAFAGHCIYNNGKFWWYVPMTHKTAKVNEGFAIGVAVSDRMGMFRLSIRIIFLKHHGFISVMESII